MQHGSRAIRPLSRIPGAFVSRGEFWRRLLLVCMAASFCLSLAESLLPDPCPNDCSGIELVSAATRAADASVTGSSHSSDHSAPSGPVSCHCAHSHITRVATWFTIPVVHVTLVETAVTPLLDRTVGRGPTAPPVPPPLA